jgi:hypothetical protein
MRSAKETVVAEHSVIAGADLIEYGQLDLDSGVSNGRKHFKQIES